MVHCQLSKNETFCMKTATDKKFYVKRKLALQSQKLLMFFFCFGMKMKCKLLRARICSQKKGEKFENFQRSVQNV
jgi:hypothetical protein